MFTTFAKLPLAKRLVCGTTGCHSNTDFVRLNFCRVMCFHFLNQRFVDFDIIRVITLSKSKLKQITYLSGNIVDVYE